MRAAYLAQDRIDINEATQTRARHMQMFNEADLPRLKRLARYLKKSPNAVRVYEEQRMPRKVRIYVDTDHAGCAVTRKSTTGPVVRYG